ncbi:hypothetical protein OROHE_019981 [Orobanche hederae]
MSESDVQFWTSDPLLDEQRNGTLPPEAFNGQGFSDHIRGGLEQLLSTIFPGEHALSTRGSGSVPSHNTEAAAAAARDTGGSSTQEPASAAVSDEGIILSNILRQIMPIISQSSTPSDEGGANLDETQADGNTEDGSSSHNSRDHQSQPSSKRQRWSKYHVELDIFMLVALRTFWWKRRFGSDD